jgi:hypothetical protein
LFSHAPSSGRSGQSPVLKKGIAEKGLFFSGRTRAAGTPKNFPKFYCTAKTLW